MNPDTTILADDDLSRCQPRGEEAQPIGDVLAELLARYRAQYPELNLTVIETPAAAAF